MYRMERVNLNSALRVRNIDHEARHDVMEQKQRIEQLIRCLQKKQSSYDQTLTVKHKRLKDAKDAKIKIRHKDGYSNSCINGKFT
jgi:hypothetical protein